MLSVFRKGGLLITAIAMLLLFGSVKTEATCNITASISQTTSTDPWKCCYKITIVNPDPISCPVNFIGIRDNGYYNVAGLNLELTTEPQVFTICLGAGMHTLELTGYINDTVVVYKYTLMANCYELCCKYITTRVTKVSENPCCFELSAYVWTAGNNCNVTKVQILEPEFGLDHGTYTIEQDDWWSMLTVLCFQNGGTHKLEYIFKNDLGEEICRKTELVKCEDCCDRIKVRYVKVSGGTETCCYNVYMQMTDLEMCPVMKVGAKDTYYGQNIDVFPVTLTTDEQLIAHFCLDTAYYSVIKLIFYGPDGIICEKESFVSCDDKDCCTRIHTTYEKTDDEKCCFKITTDIEDPKSCGISKMNINCDGKDKTYSEDPSSLSFEELFCSPTGESVTATITYYNADGVPICAKEIYLNCNPSCCDKMGIKAVPVPGKPDCWSIYFTNNDPKHCPAKKLLMTSNPGGLQKSYPLQDTNVPQFLTIVCCDYPTCDYTFEIDNGLGDVCKKSITLKPGNKRDQFNESGSEITYPSVEKMYFVPNPASESTTAYYNLSKASNVRIEIYNLVGELVQIAYQGQSTIGINTLLINTESLISGKYFVIVKSEYGSIVQPMQIIK